MLSLVCLNCSCTLFKGPWSEPSAGNSTAVIDKLIVQVPEIKVTIGWADGSLNLANGTSLIGAVLITVGVMVYLGWWKQRNRKGTS